jgi:putative membrane protein
MRRLGFVLALTLVRGGVALADSAAGSASDKSFVDRAAAGGMAEVQLSKLAMDRGQSIEVKQFARNMVEDHTKANTELKQIAQKKDITLPTKVDEKHETLYDKLSKLSGDEFDREYMRVMAQDHDETLKLLKNEAQNGMDPELKSFAMKTLPLVEKHDDMAHMDQKQLGKMKETMPQK